MVQSIFGSLTSFEHWWWLNEKERKRKKEGNEISNMHGKSTNCWNCRVSEWMRERKRRKKIYSYSTQSKHHRCFMCHSIRKFDIFCIVVYERSAHIHTHNNFRSKSFGMHVFERARQRIFIILIENWCKWFQAPPCVCACARVCVQFLSSFMQNSTMVLYFMATFLCFTHSNTRACHLCVGVCVRVYCHNSFQLTLLNPKYLHNVGCANAISHIIFLLLCFLTEA